MRRPSEHGFPARWIQTHENPTDEVLRLFAMIAGAFLLIASGVAVGQIALGSPAPVEARGLINAGAHDRRPRPLRPHAGRRWPREVRRLEGLAKAREEATQELRA